MLIQVLLSLAGPAEVEERTSWPRLKSAFCLPGLARRGEGEFITSVLVIVLNALTN